MPGEDKRPEDTRPDDLRSHVEEAIVAFSRVMQVSAMYGEAHRLTGEAINDLFVKLARVFIERDEMTIGVIGDEIAFEKEPFYDVSERIKGFIDHLKEIGVKKISFARGLSKGELAEFSKVLTMKAEFLEKMGGVEKLFELTNIRNITIGELGFRKGVGGEGPEGGRPGGEAAAMAAMDDATKKQYQEGVEYLSKTYKEIKGNQPMNVQSARQIVDGMINNLLKNKSMLLMLTSLRSHDEGGFVHGVNVTIFTLLQAEVLGIDKKYLADIGMASLLHDIGKISAAGEQAGPKEEEMTEDEKYERSQQDVQGAKILLEMEGIGVLPAIAAFEHGISYDMSGHPKKLYGKDELNLVSMMIAISEYYDKLRTSPEYHEEGGPEKAYEDMMKHSGTKFHPDLVKNFFSLIGVYPPGTLVELDTGEIALVIQASMLDIKRPQVEILYDKKGDKLEEPRIVNLLEKDQKGKYKWSIVRSISPVDKFNLPEKYTK